jgi:hypothetical protein
MAHHIQTKMLLTSTNHNPSTLQKKDELTQTRLQNKQTTTQERCGFKSNKQD